MLFIAAENPTSVIPPGQPVAHLEVSHALAPTARRADRPWLELERLSDEHRYPTLVLSGPNDWADRRHPPELVHRTITTDIESGSADDHSNIMAHIANPDTEAKR